MKKLDNLNWSPSWVSHLGCVKGCLNYLGVDVTNGWLYGGTGHAFVINMAQDACPSGPTAWKAEMLFTLGKNLGYVVDGVVGSKHTGNLAELQQRAWEYAQNALDEGSPCYGWELEIPEYYVVYGYDAVGYYYSGPGCDEGKGPKRWQELGDTGIGMVELYSVKAKEAADDVTVVRQALGFALEHAQSPAKWIFPQYKAGLDGFDTWIRDVKAGTSIQMGMAYNAAVWQTCRGFGVDFLQEAKERLDDGMGALFDEAIRRYKAVAGHLKTVTELYPFEQGLSEAPIGIDDKSHAAVESLKKAREAEAAGLHSLTKIVTKLADITHH